MAQGRFVAHVDIRTMRSLGKKRKLVLDVSSDDEKEVRLMLTAYERDAVKRVERGESPRPVEFVWQVDYMKRSLGKLRLIWALLGLTVHLMNEGMPDGKQKLTSQALYEQDMEDPEGPAPCRAIEMEATDVQWLHELQVTVRAMIPIEGTSRVAAYVVKTLSAQNDTEAHHYIEYCFNRLAMMGIPMPDEQLARVKEWWFDWMAEIDASRVELHAEEVSHDAYRTLHPLCEGCMEFIGHGGGHLAHIKSVGAGGAEPQLAKGSEWLHLCAACHLGVVHQKGWGEFLAKHPHLKGKVERALSQPALGGQEELALPAGSRRLSEYDDSPERSG